MIYAFLKINSTYLTCLKTKILYQNGAWGFVQKQDDKRFKKGDLLKPAGYNAPARNYSRGNIFTGGVVNWTGPLYMN